MAFVLNNNNDVRITKVKEWKVDFTYKGDKYLLKGSSELGEGSWATLYRKEVDETGRYTLSMLRRKYCPEYVGREFIRSLFSKNPTYSQMDVNYFVYKLTWYGFVDSVYSEMIEEKKRIIEIVDELEKSAMKEIKRARNLITDIVL